MTAKIVNFNDKKTERLSERLSEKMIKLNDETIANGLKIGRLLLEAKADLSRDDFNKLIRNRSHTPREARELMFFAGQPSLSTDDRKEIFMISLRVTERILRKGNAS